MRGHSVTRILFVPSLIGLAGNLCAAEELSLLGQTGSSGFADPVPGSFGPAGLNVVEGFNGVEDLLTGVRIGAATSSYYDSNLNQSAGTANAPVEDDFVQSLSSSMQWARNTSQLNLNLGALGSYELPLSKTDLKSSSFGFNGAASYQAGRLKLSADLRQSFNEGSNRFVGEVVRQVSFGAGFVAAYEFSRKTSLVSSFRSSWADGGEGVSATDTRSANLSAIWAYSPVLKVGPGLSYTEDAGDLLVTRCTFGPTLTANYQLSRKVSVQSMLGWEFMERGDSGGSSSLSTSVSAAYALNRLWGLNFSLIQGVDPDGVGIAEFRERTGLQFSVNHRTHGINTALVFGYDHTTFLDSTDGREPSAGVDYLNSSLSLSMPILGDRASGTVFVRYNNSMSDNVLQDWDGLQLGCSLSFQF